MADRDNSADEMLRRFLAERDIACPSCGYTLRGCPSSKCPECGTALDLALRSRPVSFWWHTCVIGLAIAEALLAVALCQSLPGSQRLAMESSVVQQVQMGFSPQSELIRWEMLLILAIEVAAGALLLGWVIAARRWFTEWHAVVRIVAGFAGASAPVLVVGLLRLLAG